MSTREQPAETSPTSTGRVRVAVLGAGLSGICMGIQLRKHGIDDFVILEKAASVGGTWRENTYPGIACDVPSHLYSYSFELNPDWSHSYSSGREIWDYCERCVDKYGLRAKIRFGWKVTDVAFDDEGWLVSSDDGRQLRADVVVSGLGGLHLPNRAKFEGLESFAGVRFHTAEWNHDHDLKGRRVAIIGTGASTAQVLPGIADDVAEVTVFQRSAAWVFPRLAHDISETTTRALSSHAVADAALSLVPVGDARRSRHDVAASKDLVRGATQENRPRASRGIGSRSRAARAPHP